MYLNHLSSFWGPPHTVAESDAGTDTHRRHHSHAHTHPKPDAATSDVHAYANPHALAAKPRAISARGMERATGHIGRTILVPRYAAAWRDRVRSGVGSVRPLGHQERVRAVADSALPGRNRHRRRRQSHLRGESDGLQRDCQNGER
jgi:hypothetical protein